MSQRAAFLRGVIDGDRTKMFGPRRFALFIISGLLLAGCGTHSKYPSFLPKKTLNPTVDAPLQGSFTHPALQVQGLPVRVVTSAFTADVKVSGPTVPGAGLPYQNDAVVCTWTVTMHDIHGTVPVLLQDFHSVDHLGSTFQMTYAPYTQRPPTVLHAGQSTTFKLRAYELIGEGMMQWSPNHRQLVAMWDYTVEND